MKQDDYVTKEEFNDAMGMISRSFDKVVTKEHFEHVLDKELTPIKNDIKELKQDVSDLKADMGYVKDKLNSIGNVLFEFVNSMKDIPARVARLEKDRWG